MSATGYANYEAALCAGQRRLRRLGEASDASLGSSGEHCKGWLRLDQVRALPWGGRSLYPCTFMSALSLTPAHDLMAASHIQIQVWSCVLLAALFSARALGAQLVMSGQLLAFSVSRHALALHGAASCVLLSTACVDRSDLCLRTSDLTWCVAAGGGEGHLASRLERAHGHFFRPGRQRAGKQLHPPVLRSLVQYCLHARSQLFLCL